MTKRNCLQDLHRVSKCLRRISRNEGRILRALHYHCSESFSEEYVHSEWYVDMYPKFRRLGNSLRNMDLIDGRLVDVNENSTLSDERLHRRMHHFKVLGRTFLGAPSVQQEIMRNVKAAMTGKKLRPPICFSKPEERDPIIFNSLHQVGNILNVSSQQRKLVRFTVCEQVTNHEVWSQTLKEILQGLKTEIESIRYMDQRHGLHMGMQIVSACLKFLAETVNRHDEDTSSWMRPKPTKPVNAASSHKWIELLEKFNDLITSLRGEEEVKFHLMKLHVMREGLMQIKDLSVDRHIGYKEVRHMESLVQKKLSKTLGHSSRCLFTLLQYYLYQTVRDVEVEIGGGLYEVGRNQLCLCMGRILTSDEEKMIWHGIKQLDRALGLFKFVWETAQMDGSLEFQGHLWCIGAKHKTFTHRGNLFFVHGISI